ncbi:MAG: polysaccharide deacetylase family protein [Synergistales bacterium]|nr:polysaccharide deacetylase family protein [Synergistales bacterium]
MGFNKRVLGILLVLLIFLSSDKAPGISMSNFPPPVFRNGNTGNPWLAITFDDGPHHWETRQLLDLLHDLDVRATFFLVGKEVLQCPDIVARMAKEGHTIGNHSFRHWNLPRLNREQIFLEWTSCSEIISNITGLPVRFCRPPGGNYSIDVLLAAQEAGLSPILWSVNSYDAGEKDPERIVSNVINHMEPGAIILFHDGFEATLKALPAIVKKAREKKLVFVTLDQMFQH